MQELKIIVDNRERNFDILEGLNSKGLKISFSQLPIGDYIISDRICVERKTVNDFENSIMDTRLFEQVERLHQSFEKPILLIEGDENDFRLSSNVILGTILALYIDYGIQIIRSHDTSETTAILSKFAEREQDENHREPRLIGRKKAFTEYQWQLLILSSIPGVGTKLAKALLVHFKTIKNVALANADQLQEIDKIGKKKADRIYKILNHELEIDSDKS